MTANDKALAACREYVAANAEIRRLTQAIGDQLYRCRGIKGTLNTMHQDSDDETHLKAFYRECLKEKIYAEVCVYGGSGQSACKILAACEHCQRAEKLVQERKAARQRLGNAKRAITNIGKTPVTPGQS